MALLDVSDAFTADFFDPFTRVRRTETVNEYGEETTLDASGTFYGSFQAASPTDLQRLPEYQTMNRVLSLVTRAHIQGPSPGIQADKIIFQGVTFVVSDVQPYQHFGQGFIQALITSVNRLDAPA